MSFQITIGDVTVLVPMGTDDTLPSSDEETDAGNADLSGNAETDTAVQGEAEEEGGHHYGVDDQGYITSEDPLLPPTKELLLGGGASLIIIGLLVWKAGPLVTKGLKARTEKIQGELDADIATAAGRSGDELRNEIARRASAAADRVVAETLDDATQQRLIEDFIQKVGAA
jgi:hypothetical protein